MPVSGGSEVPGEATIGSSSVSPTASASDSETPPSAESAFVCAVNSAHFLRPKWRPPGPWGWSWPFRGPVSGTTGDARRGGRLPKPTASLATASVGSTANITFADRPVWDPPRPSRLRPNRRQCRAETSCPTAAVHVTQVRHATERIRPIPATIVIGGDENFLIMFSSITPL